MRFVQGLFQGRNLLDLRRTLAKGQSPEAAVLSCADSRVPAEIIFDQSLGDLFVVRTAGLVLDPTSIGSLEYAVAHLHVPLLVTQGHESHRGRAPGGRGGQVFSPCRPGAAPDRDFLKRGPGCYRGPK
jgi:carbonic anhydrase